MNAMKLIISAFRGCKVIGTITHKNYGEFTYYDIRDKKYTGVFSKRCGHQVFADGCAHHFASAMVSKYKDAKYGKEVATSESEVTSSLSRRPMHKSHERKPIARKEPVGNKNLKPENNSKIIRRSAIKVVASEPGNSTITSLTKRSVSKSGITRSKLRIVK